MYAKINLNVIKEEIVDDKNDYCPTTAAMAFHCPYPDILSLGV
jgi:hypothetical protein